ncbi:MAG: ADP-forming succinate--CoA ligase subunit beta [Candidatus Thiodiazotropha sp. (ex Lucinoma aequizonata)]|nr:ADP-forming succinate--CoA ligase subunit beta [Candidatus Thiodiazotropha sp. (ex Lucinoma aequizonata)]MCU7889284.1 ADP-forming succinate--CoA ligase subunit beta [Candidatus Thiodiazotropha sp. (ex Lucinoma aequizonata)]MCU7896662.1 ADP-forming succinate--CoA ligase subunit beta [Candidatus Thiodiazotropha sp. (ex Lucinoma aequizonata)]MCU7899122.1 ADP-forming succinate--CoA ligase subunit beta [Candidatus Thiodiazotropha sp. (ex Lucinoma aequizonata)]MCU7903818.1 ADP-forming succinate--C
MNLHEYHAKSLFANYGIPVPQGRSVSSPNDARSAAQGLGGHVWVVKAQAHTGGRCKAGGVKLCRTLDEVEQAASEILGMTLVTNQTDPQGLPVNNVLVEEGSKIAQELYLGALLDRTRSRIAFMASAAGGMNIEEVATETPDKILTTAVNPSTGMLPFQCRKLAFGLGLMGDQIKQFSKIMTALYRLYSEKDISLIEINPLIVTTSGQLIALDAKINLDSNALYRHQELVALRDITQEDEKEAAAAQHNLNYITLDGSIGCMVNGAGLAMATMDMIKLHGGEPANFLDVGGGITAERVTEAFKLILSDDKVKTVLVNIFGGIVRCDLIAEGIITAARSIGVPVPIVVRLEGTNAQQGLEMLESSGLDFITANDFTEAAKKTVTAAA